MRRADGNDDEHHFDALEQHRLERRQAGEVVGAAVIGLLVEGGGLLEKAASSSCSAMTPTLRRMAFRSQRMPNRISSTPTTNCSVVIGTSASSGPNASTSAASNARAKAAPVSAGRQLRVTPTASTMVKASTTSTKEARNAAVTVERMGVSVCIRASCHASFAPEYSE